MIMWSSRGFAVPVVQLKGGGGDDGLVLSPVFDPGAGGEQAGDDCEGDDAEDDEDDRHCHINDGEVAANLVLVVDLVPSASARAHPRRTGKLISEPLEYIVMYIVLDH